jgi:hypothetical protein
VNTRPIRVVTAIFGALLAAAVLAATATATPITVETEEATDIAAHEATLNGTVYSHEHETRWGFQYATQQHYKETGGFEYGVQGAPIPAGKTSPIPVSLVVKELEANQTYAFRLVALSFDGGGVAYGDVLSLSMPTDHVPRFEAAEYPAEVSGEQDPEGDFMVLESPGVSVHCGSSQWSGELGAAGPGLALGASFEGCEETLSGGAASVAMNGCDFSFGLANAGPPYSGGIGVSCEEAGEAIEISLAELGIVLKATAQEAVDGVEYENHGKGTNRSVHAAVDAEGIDYSCEGVLCFLVGENVSSSMSGGIGLS